MLPLGSLYFDNTSLYEKEDDVISPGQEHTYQWEVTSEVSPTAADPPCITYTYLSHYDIVKDYNTGLIGTMLICKKGMWQDPGFTMWCVLWHLCLDGLWFAFIFLLTTKSHLNTFTEWLCSYLLCLFMWTQHLLTEIQCWGKWLLKIMHYNIALLPKKVTHYVT